MALEPAVTLAELEPPEAILSPSEEFSPVPESATVCGLSGALSVIVRVPGRLPVAVGVKVTLGSAVSVCVGVKVPLAVGTDVGVDV